jgi:group I intron endonuclease
MYNQGVYVIENLVNGRKYVGSTTNLKRRLREHKTELLKGNHKNSYLQRSYNKYGKDNFKIYTVEIVVDFKDLTTCEAKWIGTFRTTENDYGYNLVLPNPNTAPNGGAGIHHDITKEKIRRSFYKNHFGETSEEKYQTWKANVEHRERSGEPRADSTVLVYNYETGEKLYEFESPTKTAEVLNLNRKKVIAVLNKEKASSGTKIARSHKGFKFVYKRNLDEGLVYKKDSYKNMNFTIELLDENKQVLGEYNNMKQVSEVTGIKSGTLGSAILKGTLVHKKYYLRYK